MLATQDLQCKVARTDPTGKGHIMQLTRRTILQGAAASLALNSLGPKPVWATTALEFGTMQVQTLSDGYLTLPGDLLFAPMPQDELATILTRHGVTPGAQQSDCNITLLRDGDRLVVFDTGSGPSFQQSAGKLADALDSAGVAPGDVTHVVFTHAHPDHLWGVLDDFDDPFFPKAKHMIGRAEWDYWINPNTVDTIDTGRTTMAVGAQRRLTMLQDAITLFDDGQEILPGVAARATYGHTPGHMSFELRSGHDSVMVLGDALTNSHVAFERPGWASGPDHDQAAAAATRTRLLDQVSADQMRLIGYHLPGGGMGRAERRGDSYRFIPENA
jgi:glyoxylase-like metal-dependent hydrolase (beta-lactamase superfamily II)